MKQVIENPQDEVNLLRKHAKDLRDQKTKLAKELKNAQRKTRRMQQRAKSLSDEELLSVLCMRSCKRSADGKTKMESAQNLCKTDMQKEDTPKELEGTEGRPADEANTDKQEELVATTAEATATSDKAGGGNIENTL